MIQINELRIGNLIERNGILAKIEIINNELDEVYSLGEDFYYSDFCCNIEPILLTEEWLLKLGFELDDDDLYTLCLFSQRDPKYNSIELWTRSNEGIKIILEVDEGEMPEQSCVPLHHIKYVHQLQNLYFCLTGAELTVA